VDCGGQAAELEVSGELEAVASCWLLGGGVL
jgi:hypothetical protein